MQRFIATVVISALLATGCGQQDLGRSNAASVDLHQMTSTSIAAANLKDRAAFIAKLDEQAQLSFSTMFDQMVSTTTNDTVEIDGITIDHALDTLELNRGQFESMNETYANLGTYWNDMDVGPDADFSAASLAHALKIANSAEGLALVQSQPASLQLLDLNCNAANGTALGCSLGSTVACAFSWVPIIGAIACAVTSACAVAASITSAVAEAKGYCKKSDANPDDAGFKAGANGEGPKWTVRTTTNSCENIPNCKQAGNVGGNAEL